MFFASFLELWGFRKRCALPQGVAIGFSFFSCREPTGILVSVSSPDCLCDDLGANCQPALCVRYVSAMSTHCRVGLEFAVAECVLLPAQFLGKIIGI